MKQTSTFLSTYTADVSGVCSALYELGGMVIMHDASGCNSTYNTHDEPRWYQMDSMIYISALTELDAMLGNDDKLIMDICKAASDLKPRFIALCGTPIPMVVGTDFSGIARVIEQRTKIPTFGFSTNGMHSYLSGIDMAFSAFAKRFCIRVIKGENNTAGIPVKPQSNDNQKPSINLLGVTPLDFSVTGNVEAMKAVFEENGYHIHSCFAMGSTFEELTKAGFADVNVIVSSCGYATAKYLEEEFGIPYVVGIPMGTQFTKELFSSIDQAAGNKENRFPVKDYLNHIPEYETDDNHMAKPNLLAAGSSDDHKKTDSIFLLGEPVFASSLRYTLIQEFGFSNVRIISPLESDPIFLSDRDAYLPYENEIREKLADAAIVIADPLYRRVIAKDNKTLFLDFPHEAYSGRIYRNDIPVVIGDSLNHWLMDQL